MSSTWFLQFLSLGLLLNADTCSGAECDGSTQRKDGWFGPDYLYVDLLSMNAARSTPYWVYDFPDNLCNDNQNRDPVRISLNDEDYFTWLRLKLRPNTAINSHAFEIQLKNDDDRSVDCGNMYTTVVNDTTLDIHCQSGVFFQKLDITGDGVGSLCQVYISGGRNVALRQKTQTSDAYSGIYSRAVDGNTDSNSDHYNCSHIQNEWRHKWTLTFERPHQVNKYVLYNRDKRLQGFKLKADQQNGSVAFVYNDLLSTPQNIYRIQSDTPNTPIASVSVVATHRDYSNQIILSLREVEMFGDAVCPAGFYGRYCNNRCNCAQSGENCFVSTGGCPSGCAPGFQGEGCKMSCSETFYGFNCSSKCSPNCKNQLCQPNNGTCLSCIIGKQSPLCDKGPQKPVHLVLLCFTFSICFGMLPFLTGYTFE